ncbi:hypothetical protein [Nocardia sienata]|uniref:hypothetical protein n=1 Tax=Nocardia sienata TaxID=248552 RepID=UPI0007A5020E|nr:hypothetical protein [Nocardia sienata]
MSLRVLFVGLLMFVSLAGVGCTESVDRAAADTETGTGPDLIREATEYGDWTLPVNGKVLLVKKEVGRVPRFRLAVEMSPPDLVWMLEESRYSTPLGPGHALSISTIAGPDPNSSPKLLYARDNITSPSGNLVFRKVLVDERDAQTRIVHLEFLNI